MIARTLLTGFSSFGTVVSNPTERLVAQFGIQASCSALTTAVIPVSFAAASEIVQNLIRDADVQSRPFDTVLMLGVNSGASEWRIERYGRNYDEPGRPDAFGTASPGRVIVPDGPDLVGCTLPTEELVRKLNAEGIPATTSDSAGGYLCNHLLYSTLLFLAGRTGVRAGFVHVPADYETFRTGETPSLGTLYPFHTHVRAIEVILSELGAL